MPVVIFISLFLVMFFNSVIVFYRRAHKMLILIPATLIFSVLNVCSAVTVRVSIDGHAVEGQETRLVCTVQKSNPTNTNDPTIRWREVVNGSPVTIVEYQEVPSHVHVDYADRFSVEGDGSQLTLVIDNTMRTDDGIYQCEVNVLNDPPSPVSGAVTISVVFLDSIMLDVTPNPVAEGESVMCVCSVNAEPDPTINLYKDEALIKTETTKNLAYNIDNVARSNGGNYKCEASNIAGTDTSQIKQLDVQYKPEFGLVNEDTAGQNEQYVIEFEVAANPSDVTYQWTTDPSGIEDTDTNPATFTVNVPDVNVTVFTITVDVANSIGLTSKSIEITVLVPSTINAPTTTLTTKVTSTTGGGGAVVDKDKSPIAPILGGVIGCLILVGLIVGLSYKYDKLCFSRNAKKARGGGSEKVVLNSNFSDVDIHTYAQVQKPKSVKATKSEHSEQAVTQTKPPDKPQRAPSRDRATEKQLTYADLDLTKDVNTGSKDKIIRTQPETEYSSIMITKK
ncbi:hemicentin-1-like isoform X2 [Anneissia japonica]|uniref:hemicentin-1-like isoform X2 n=1 Tax=Anneissia japonica TaxID=1529436 RepID=UPI001425B8D9|nr:hemicentin-1-like isoform X2 [Anneissia japonica]